LGDKGGSDLVFDEIDWDWGQQKEKSFIVVFETVLYDINPVKAVGAGPGYRMRELGSNQKEKVLWRKRIQRL